MCKIAGCEGNDEKYNDVVSHHVSSGIASKLSRLNVANAKETILKKTRV